MTERTLRKLALDAYVAGGKRAHASGGRYPDLGFDAWWAERYKFRHGDRVRLKRRPRPGQGPRTVGTIRNQPGPNARIVYVKWPDGWAGHEHVDELELVAIK